MGGGGGKNTTTSTKVELPGWAQGYAQGGLERAYEFSRQPYQQYPGERIAPMAPQQEAGLAMTENRALSNPVSQAAEAQTVDTLRGAYLDPTQNPAFEPTLTRLTDAYRTGVAPQTAAAFSQAKAFGPDNSAYQQTTALNNRAFGDSITNMAAGIYNNERTNQMRALALSPTVNQQGYADASALTGAGDARRALNQDYLNLQLQDWTDAKNHPYDQLAGFANLYPAFLGNQGTTSATGPNPNQANPMANAAAGALSGYALSALGPAALSGYGLPLALAGGALGLAMS